MSAIKPISYGNYDVQETALTMAIAVFVERIGSLPQEDKNDLFELYKALAIATTQEERLHVANAMREILDQAPVKANPLTLPANTSPPLKKWIDYISRRIKEERERANLTQVELAAIAGLPQSHISRLENGQHSPSYITLEKIAKALQISVSQLDPSAD